jgi:hypothetical protein
MALPLLAPPSPLYPPCVLPSHSLAIRPSLSKEEDSGFIYTTGNSSAVVGGSAQGPNEGLLRYRVTSGSKRNLVRAGCPPFGEVEQRLLPPLLGGGRAKGQEGAGARQGVWSALRRGWSCTRAVVSGSARK